jgi:hypothetical protein
MPAILGNMRQSRAPFGSVALRCPGTDVVKEMNSVTAWVVLASPIVLILFFIYRMIVAKRALRRAPWAIATVIVSGAYAVLLLVLSVLFALGDVMVNLDLPTGRQDRHGKALAGLFAYGFYFFCVVALIALAVFVHALIAGRRQTRSAI